MHLYIFSIYNVINQLQKYGDIYFFFFIIIIRSNRLEVQHSSCTLNSCF